MSIFNTSPPAIDEKTLENWLLKNYDFLNDGIISFKKLNSERDFNIKIITKKNKKFVVKISNPAENLNILKLQDSMLKYLSSSDIKHFIPIPLHDDIKNLKDLNNRKCFVRILTFLDGEVFANNQNNEILCKNLSKFLGNLTLSLEKFEHPFAHRKFTWNSSDIEWIEDYINLFSENSKKDIIKIVLKSFKLNIKPKLSKIRYSIIHGDANNYNILVSNNDIVGLLDYGDSIYAPSICELTVALAYSLMNSSNIIDKCSYMVKSFHSIFPLTKIEIELLSTFIASRLLITVTMANIQKKKYPNNEYLTISENDAWNLLFKLKDINLDNLTLDLLKICNYEK